MRFALVLLVLVLVLLAVVVVVDARLLMVQTLTRHGTRAPDRIVGKEICKPLFTGRRKLKDAFLQLFGVGPTELTGVGVRQMRDVGGFLRERYHGFINADYAAHSDEWEFLAKEGDRQQRSMMGIVLGVFPNDVVPIAVTHKATDSILGGPAAQCGWLTRDYIIQWHRTEGRRLVQSSRFAELMRTLQRVCNTTLLGDPVNELSAGANPHAYIGDISDLMDSLSETRFEALLPISDSAHALLTELAFALEHGAHFAFPGGAAMHAGSFPDHLLETFEEIVDRNQAGQNGRPKNVPKIKMHTCSRELFYGLAEIFDWTKTIRLPGQPVGRISHGTTFIWELHSDYTIHSFYYQLPDEEVFPLMPPVSIEEFRQLYQRGVRECGTWDELCVANKTTCAAPAWYTTTTSTTGTMTDNKTAAATVVQARMSNPPANTVAERHKRYRGGWEAYFGWVVITAFVLLLLVSARRTYYDGYSYL